MSDKIKKAREHLNKEEYNEGLAILEELPEDVPEAEVLREQLSRRRKERLEELLQQIEAAMGRKEWGAASDLIQQAQALDRTDKRVQAAAQLLYRMAEGEKYADEVAEKKQRAQALFNRSEKTITDLETAIRLLDEAISRAPGDLEALDLLDKVRRLRSDFLKSQGQISTLEQAEAFEDALKHINHLIAQGLKEFQGKNIYDYRSELEKKAAVFAEGKAGKYLAMATAELENDPKLALDYIKIGLELPFIPKIRRDDLDDLKLKAERAYVIRNEVDKMVQEALSNMNIQANYEQAIRILEGALVQLPNHAVAQRHLERARVGFKNMLINDARNMLARLRGFNVQSDLDKARTELSNISNRLEAIGDEGKALQAECEKLLEEISRREQIERQVKAAASQAETALKRGDLITTEMAISELGPGMEDHIEIRKLRKALAQRQEIEQALEKARRAFAAGQLESAQEQIAVLQSRNPNHQEVLKLSKEIEATISFNEGVDAYNDGLFREARQALQKVVGFDGLYKTQAGEYLAKIENFAEQDRQAQAAYEVASKHKQHQRWEAAYRELAAVENIPSTVKKDIADLRQQVRRQWREQLSRQAKDYLHAKSFDQAHQVAKKLEEIQAVEDTKLINEIKKSYNMRRAEIAGAQSNWVTALQHWQEAQRFDAVDERITQGLAEARKRQALQEANAALAGNQTSKAIVLLEPVFNLAHVDPEIEERLLRAYLLSEEYGKAVHLTSTRVNIPSAFAGTARVARALCEELQTARAKFNEGAYQEGLKIVQKCAQQDTEFQDVLNSLYERRRKEAIDKIWKEAQELENNDERPTRTLPKYRELLEIEPDHRQAKRRKAELVEKFNHYVDDLIHKSQQLRDEENVSPEEVETRITEILEAKSIANEQQQIRLNPYLESLADKRRALEELEKKLRQIRSALTEAKESGDFTDVDRWLREAGLLYAPERNVALSKLIREVQGVKDRRTKALRVAEQIRDAQKAQDFAALETLVDDLLLHDPDDSFHLQHRLQLADVFRSDKIKIGFSGLKVWAQQRRKNLELLSAWFEQQKMDPKTLEQEEARLREGTKNEISFKNLVKGLNKLANDYHNGANRLAVATETPLSERSGKIIAEAETLQRQFLEKARQLEEEAGNLAHQEETVQELIEDVARLIGRKKFVDAQPLVEQALQLSPSHPLLHHYQKLIRDGLK